jgi:hypothetical protein
MAARQLTRTRLFVFALASVALATAGCDTEAKTAEAYTKCMAKVEAETARAVESAAGDPMKLGTIEHRRAIRAQDCSNLRKTCLADFTGFDCLTALASN